MTRDGTRGRQTGTRADIRKSSRTHPSGGLSIPTWAQRRTQFRHRPGSGLGKRQEKQIPRRRVAVTGDGAGSSASARPRLMHGETAGDFCPTARTFMRRRISQDNTLSTRTCVSREITRLGDGRAVRSCSLHSAPWIALLQPGGRRPRVPSGGWCPTVVANRRATAKLQNGYTTVACLVPLSFFAGCAVGYPNTDGTSDGRPRRRRCGRDENDG